MKNLATSASNVQNKDLFIVLIRLFLGYIFFSAGVCKLTHGHFGQVIGPPWLEESLAKYGLGLFAQVVAVCQVVCGALLLSQRYSLLGTIMLVPMNVAILAVTVSMNWTGTPYVNAFFLTLNLLLLLMERQKFSFLFKPTHTHTVEPTLTDAFGQNIFSWIGLGFSVLIIIVAPFNIVLTNAFAAIIFVAFALTILQPRLLNKLDIALVSLPFLGMTIVTYAGLTGLAAPLLLVVLAAEGILLLTRIYTSTRKPEAAAANFAASAAEA